MGLSSFQLQFLQALGEYLQAKKINSYLVGGCVRDLLMQTTVKDLDVMLEADATEVLAGLYRDRDFNYQVLKPVLFKKYKTAKAKFEVTVPFSKSSVRSFEKMNYSQIEIDFSSARKEIYSEIAANPICTPATIKEDLARRDFSVNAIALSLLDLNSPIDLFNGVLDLKHRQLRVLHPHSFRDDPVRLLRAIRFICRFNFSLEAQTSVLFQEAIDKSYAKFLPQDRCLRELRKALDETCWAQILHMMKEKNLLKQFSPLLFESCQNFDLANTSLDSILNPELKRKLGFKDVF